MTTRLFYDDVGSGNPLLLVHAFPLSRAMWQPQIGALAGSMRLIAPDLRGFGDSPLGIPPTSLDDYADDLLGLLDQLGLHQVTLAGLSMGGYIAFALLRRAPERISGLILADTRAGADSDEAKQGRAKNAQIAEESGALAVGEAMLPRLVAATAPESLRDQLRRIIAANSGAGVAAALRAMAARPDSSALLPGIAVPTLVIVGSEDVLTPPAEAQAMASTIPTAQLVEIAGAGHLANLEAPDQFNAAMRRFMQ